MGRSLGSHSDPAERSAEDAAAASHYVAESASDEAKDLFKKQAGLQAVRGLGVSLVVFHHMTGKMTNAAAVFDAFFVISGYLISMRLIMLAQTTSIRDYFVTFYTFRIRRIFPAAIATLVFTAIVANLIYLPNRAHDATVDTVWAFFFMANWHFAHNAVDYFSAGATSSPVLNFWSLSVEEQFYLAWPLVILVALFVARRRGRGTGVTPVALVIIVVSYGYGWWMSRSHPVEAYYDTFARVWDFGIGALMANIAVGQVLRKDRGHRTDREPRTGRRTPLWRRLHGRARDHAGLISWVGVALFILAMFFTPPLGYPVPSASFGLVGMGVIFYADTLKRDPNAVFAKALPFIWLGDLSYAGQRASTAYRGPLRTRPCGGQPLQPQTCSRNRLQLDQRRHPHRWQGQLRVT